jgi:hypothetical protein
MFIGPQASTSLSRFTSVRSKHSGCTISASGSERHLIIDISLVVHFPNS